jgi:hypothetical protein
VGAGVHITWGGPGRGGGGLRAPGVDVRNHNGDTHLTFAASSGHLGATALLFNVSVGCAREVKCWGRRTVARVIHAAHITLACMTLGFVDARHNKQPGAHVTPVHPPSPRSCSHALLPWPLCTFLHFIMHTMMTSQCLCCADVIMVCISMPVLCRYRWGVW